MAELLPTTQASRIQSALRDYLTTTFALADSDARSALDAFLSDADDGIFKGPYIRTRLPFSPASPFETIATRSPQGTDDTSPLGAGEGPFETDASRPPQGPTRTVPKDAGWGLDVVPEGFVPHSHQAEAWRRLSSKGQRPKPALVTTGTGSGKTEAFLMPILDHVLRAKREGTHGVKALILYPMNALANDQASRLARLIVGDGEPGSTNPYAGIRAAIYTGEKDKSKNARSSVTADGLIDDRYAMRQNVPDILLTNYKMLDHLLLRGEDRQIWADSTESLQYVVLDEFHTYDGAQGTDVAMLLRRLGLTLKSYLAEPAPDASEEELADWARPLGKITPVGTSATLGDGGDSSVMIDFATEVFGEQFDESCVVTESRLTTDEWLADAEAPAGASPQPITATLIDDVVAKLDGSLDGVEITDTLLSELFGQPASAKDDAERLRQFKALPIFRDLLLATEQATSLDDLPAALHLPADLHGPKAATFVSFLIAAASHLRAANGRSAVNIEVHLWVRELTRIDRTAEAAARYHWSDDGQRDAGVDTYPAIFCRHCGRSGWGVELSPTGLQLVGNSATIRRNHVTKQGSFRPLISAPTEGEAHLTQPVEGLVWFDTTSRFLTSKNPDTDDRDFSEGRILPVLTHKGPDAADDARRDVCPACGEPDGIRFLGSAIATMLSVSLSSLFGTPALDEREKKALIFTDSVQDAAHRAGFVAARSQTLTMRSVIRDAFNDDAELDLEELADAIMTRAGDDPFARFRILPTDLANEEPFAKYWRERRVPRGVLRDVRRRLLFDLILEFGLASKLGRTLERTGSLAAHVETGSPARMAALAREVWEKSGEQAIEATPTDAEFTAWVRGITERLRNRGAIMHEWLHKFVDQDGCRWMIWGDRPRGQGMPAFPLGRSAPAFPKHGGAKSAREQLLDNIHEHTGWYARWTAQMLGVSTNHGAVLVRMLLDLLSADGVVETRRSTSGATVYALPTSRVVVRRVEEANLREHHLLVCGTCSTQWPGAMETVDQLEGAPCLNTRCGGTLMRGALAPDGFYRRLYSSPDMRRIVAREHTSLLPAEVRLGYERGFKEGGDQPDQPNVLVATPTLEMGIDIGDLSAVFLSSLPRTVASYLQRIGRAGRATGNAVTLAYVTGRGEALPRWGNPQSMINGAVRPPAIYLSAVEILQRQYLAHLVDRCAMEDASPHTPAGAMQSTEPDSFLGKLITDAETHHEEHLERFLAAFGDRLRREAQQHLRRWATPVDGPLTSPLAGHLLDASQRWRDRAEELNHRIDEIQSTLPELEQAANVAAATDDAKKSLQMAHSALNLTKKQIANLKSAYWISVMEEFGLLPNYTLLGDSTTLDVSISWHNPDTREYEQETADFQRPTDRALQEFAPGAKFYARGWEIEIDSIDLGSNAEGIHTWACCAVCGFALDLTEHGSSARISECPRCKSNTIADVGQRFEAVEFMRASADIRREEARIDDRRDDRQRKRFEVVGIADVDPHDVARQWYVKGYDFGAKYLTRVTLRWLNLGTLTSQASKRTLASQIVPATLFRVCEGCGHIDSEAGANSRTEHRPWCRYRTSPDEHTRSIALKRTLTTQGVVLPLPYDVTAGDTFAQPSLEAALLMGIRNEFGGSPDHIEVATIRDPRDDQSSAPALLLHDAVPGGTGYLADLAEPENLWALLHSAYEHARDCPCQIEGRLACHRCLLPFAPPHLADSVSRATAERHLRTILNSGDRKATEVPHEMVWEESEQLTRTYNSESVLESRFREAFLKLADDIGMQVKERPSTTSTGNVIQLTQNKQIWTLKPQVLEYGTEMDFQLLSNNPPLKIAIYLDGYMFHASPDKNRIADDAHKRANLRDAGYHVLSITWQDLDGFDRQRQADTPWVDHRAIPQLLSPFAFNQQVADAALQGPMTTLVSLLQQPTLSAWEGLARGLPVAVPRQRYATIPEGTNLSGAAAQMLHRANVFPADGTPNAWWWQQDHVGILVHRWDLSGWDFNVVVIVDDRAPAVGQHYFRTSWQTWLAISNALMFREGAGTTTITTVSQAAPLIGETGVTTGSLPPEWQERVDQAYADPDLAIELHKLGVTEPDMAGEEVGANNIPIDFAWSVQKVVVLLEPEPDDVADLEADGWRVFGPDASAIAAALQEEAK